MMGPNLKKAANNKDGRKCNKSQDGKLDNKKSSNKNTISNKKIQKQDEQ